ncbi:MAG: ATPase [Firmicutes bacterium]|nr:ATPase [Bacillota bacterium]
MSTKTDRIKHYFAGGNTGEGFYSFYDQIMGPDANRLYLLKGGPGSGKSTFMREIGQVMLAHGFELEYFHCSSDPNSLDGVAIPALKIGLIDGTAPHTMDPVNPGVVDEIINLGAFLDETPLTTAKKKIMETAAKKKSCFERAYVYLAAAKGVYHHWETTNHARLASESWLPIYLRLREEIFGQQKPSGKLGTLRRLFASAITPDGPVNYLESLFGGARKIYALEGPPGSGQSFILERLVATTQEYGLSGEVYHCALDPKRIEHLYLPKLKIGVVTSHWPHQFCLEQNCELIDTSSFIKQHSHLSQETVKEARLVFLDLLERSINWLQKARTLHIELEKHYSTSMDWQRSAELRDEIIRNLLRTYHGEG